MTAVMSLRCNRKRSLTNLILKLGHNTRILEVAKTYEENGLLVPLLTKNTNSASIHVTSIVPVKEDKRSMSAQQQMFHVQL